MHSFRLALAIGWLSVLAIPALSEPAPTATTAEPAAASAAAPAKAPAAATVVNTTATAVPAAEPAPASDASSQPVATTAAPSAPSADGAAATAKPETAAAEATPPPAPVDPTLEIAINLTSQRMTVTENGKAKYTWPISSGAFGYPTPTGTFKPIWTSKMWYSRKYDMAPMPHSIFFHGGTAIHATYSVGMLGRPASHGCVRLSPSNAATLYRMVGKHGKAATKIAVFGKPKYSAPKIARNTTKPERYAAVRQNGGYASYGYSPYATSAPRYVYPGDQRMYYVQSQKRRAQMLKQRRVVMRQYYSSY